MATKNSYQFQGPKPPDWYEGNGCGALGSGILDWALKRLGVPIGPACRWHDWAYKILRDEDQFGEFIEWKYYFDRKDADEWFRDNIRILSKAEARVLRSAKRRRLRNWVKSFWKQAGGGIVSVVAYRVVRRLGKYTL